MRETALTHGQVGYLRFAARDARAARSPLNPESQGQVFLARHDEVSNTPPEI